MCEGSAAFEKTFKNSSCRENLACLEFIKLHCDPMYGRWRPTDLLRACPGDFIVSKSQVFSQRKKCIFAFFFENFGLQSCCDWNHQHSWNLQCASTMYEPMYWSPKIFKIIADFQINADKLAHTSAHFRCLRAAYPLVLGGVVIFFDLAKKKQFPIGIQSWTLASFFSGSFIFAYLVKKVVAK